MAEGAFEKAERLEQAVKEDEEKLALMASIIELSRHQLWENFEKALLVLANDKLRGLIGAVPTDVPLEHIDRQRAEKIVEAKTMHFIAQMPQRYDGEVAKMKMAIEANTKEAERLRSTFAFTRKGPANDGR
jgi:hypothetical protein